MDYTVHGILQGLLHCRWIFYQLTYQGNPRSIPESGRYPRKGIIGYPLQYSWTSLVAQSVKNPPAMWETKVQSLGWEDPLEEGMATHSSILAWRIPMDTGALEGCGPWGHKELDTTEWLSTHKYEKPHILPVVHLAHLQVCGGMSSLSPSCGRLSWGAAGLLNLHILSEVIENCQFPVCWLVLFGHTAS